MKGLNAFKNIQSSIYSIYFGESIITFRMQKYVICFWITL